MAALIQSHHPGTEEELKSGRGGEELREPDGRKHKTTENKQRESLKEIMSCVHKQMGRGRSQTFKNKSCVSSEKVNIA